MLRYIFPDGLTALLLASNFLALSQRWEWELVEINIIIITITIITMNISIITTIIITINAPSFPSVRGLCRE